MCKSLDYVSAVNDGILHIMTYSKLPVYQIWSQNVDFLNYVSWLELSIMLWCSMMKFLNYVLPYLFNCGTHLIWTLAYLMLELVLIRA